ncbi:hypothetical protein ET471_11010 [Xylanimonas protaetiae]|uniref:Uncharacterized protein n=1 Tax=Xylanimonas protaetiae TaxID=2509457 RepID=A0A4P6F741_9MICO|nr:hypothetical protein ET471_11010 [Xylanimonas protaetiae]
MDVSAALAARWRAWFAPEQQPFVVSPAQADALGRADEPDRLTPELRDTFFLWGPREGQSLVWLGQADVRALPREERRALLAAQAAPHRWDSDRLPGRLLRWVEEGRRPSAHDVVPDAVWRDAASAGLAGARALAGRFPTASGPNCFGTVMAATGVDGAADVWMQREPFEKWLAGTRPTTNRRDDRPGTVLVWRDGAGAVQHAAVTLGGGWALHKPSQCWYSPVKVLTVAGVKASARTPGWHLSRHVLAG